MVSLARWTVLTMAAGFVLSCASQASAWGDDGHRIVCRIAFRLLDQKRQEKIVDLTKAYRRPNNGSGFGSFEDGCIFADEVRRSCRPDLHTDSPRQHTCLPKIGRLVPRDFLVRLKFGSTPWNRWRQENPDVAIVLDGAVLNGMILTGVNFSGVSLRRASLHATNLMNADLRGADLTDANLVEADLIGAQLHGAVLTGANLHEADLLGADPSNARCSLDDLKGALHVAYPFEIRAAGDG